MFYVYADKFRPFRVPVTDAYLIPNVLLLAPTRIAKPAILAFNKFAAPAINRWIAGIVRKKAQGADLPHAPLTYASPWPLPLEPACPGLPHDLIEEIQSAASEDAGRLGTVARNLFMVATLEGLPEAREIYEGSPLVHTSYFNHEAVRQLIALHIARTIGDSMTGDNDLSRWLAANAKAVQARIGKFTAGRL